MTLAKLASVDKPMRTGLYFCFAGIFLHFEGI